MAWRGAGFILPGEPALDCLTGYRMKTMKGAEALLKKIRVLGFAAVEKFRLRKEYRAAELDEKIRKLRTRNEAKLLERASKIISVPKVLKVDENKKEIIMQAIEGKRLSGNLDKFSPKKLDPTAFVEIPAEQSTGIEIRY